MDLSQRAVSSDSKSFLSGCISRYRAPIEAPINIDLNNDREVSDVLDSAINNLHVSHKPNFSLIAPVVSETVTNQRSFLNAGKVFDFKAPLSQLRPKIRALFNEILPNTTKVFDMINTNPLVLTTDANPPAADPPCVDPIFGPHNKRRLPDTDLSEDATENKRSKCVPMNDPTPPTALNTFHNFDKGVGAYSARVSISPYSGFDDPMLDTPKSAALYSPDTGSNHPYYKLCRGLPTAAYDVLKSISLMSSSYIWCRTKTQAWMMSAANFSAKIGYVEDDGFDPKVVAKYKKFRLFKQPYDIYSASTVKDNRSYAYFTDGADIVHIEMEYSKGSCIGYVFPAIDLSSYDRVSNIPRFEHYPSVDVYGFASFTIVDYNGIRDSFRLKILDSWTFSMSFKDVYDKSKSKVWAVKRQEELVMAPFKLGCVHPIRDLSECSPTSLSSLVVTPSRFKLKFKPVYDMKAYNVRCYLDKAALVRIIVSAKTMTITIIGQKDTRTTRMPILLPDMELWFFGHFYFNDNNFFIEVLSGFSSSKPSLPGYRGLCTDGLLLIHTAPCFYYKDYPVVQASESSMLSVDIHALCFDPESSLYLFPVVASDGYNAKSAIAVPPCASSAWLVFMDIICPVFDYTALSGDSYVKIKCILNQSPLARKLSPYVTKDGYLNCPIQIIENYKGAFDKVFIVADPDKLLLKMDLPFVSDERNMAPYFWV